MEKLKENNNPKNHYHVPRRGLSRKITAEKKTHHEGTEDTDPHRVNMGSATTTEGEGFFGRCFWHGGAGVAPIHRPLITTTSLLRLRLFTLLESVFLSTSS
ncbi:hypothetical protein L1049_015517 [Liquidambar formosana]|uniref:Uncharacterized protein n=1 Tax=Liquidambar formosana TaxID=63359 RepID=A0AAP0RXZ5_LIQFO